MIIMFKGQSIYDSLRIFTDELAMAFDSLGKDIYIIDLLQDDCWTQVQNALSFPIDFIFSFNSMGANTVVNNTSITEFLGVPFISSLVDHPYHHMRRIEYKLKYNIVTCLDHEHCRIARDMVKGDKEICFLPLAARENDKPVKKIGEREIDVLVSGSYSNADSIRTEWFAGINDDRTKGVLDDTCDYIVNYSDLSPYEAIYKVTKENGYDYDALSNKARASFFAYVDSYTRAYKREKYIRNALKAGVTVDCYGGGWESFSYSGDNLNVHNAVDFNTSIDLMEDSKLVINCMPNFMEGYHDRIFNAAISGAVCLTDSNRLLSEEFKDDENIAFFSGADENNISDRIIDLISDEKKMQRIALSGHEYIKLNHTWKNRATEILKVIDEYKNKHLS